MITLGEDGPQTIPDLLAATRVPLALMLNALKDVREFHLVELVGDDNVIQLTNSGSRTATVARGNNIREEAGKKLLPA